MERQKDMFSYVAASDYKRQRKKEQRREMLDSLGSDAALRQNGEYLQCEEAHKTVVLNMDGEDERPPPLRELGTHKNVFDHHHNWHLIDGPS